MSAAKSPAPEPQKTAEVIKAGKRDFADFAPSMLKHKVVALIFLPWLTRFTGRVAQAAREEERRAILAIPDLPETAKTMIREWMEQA